MKQDKERALKVVGSSDKLRPKIPAEVYIKKPNNKENFFCQWSVGKGNVYSPIPKSINKLKSGFYSVYENEYGFQFTKEYLDMSELLRFPDSVADSVINEFDSFWDKKQKYLDRGEPHKRGFLLWGPPGGGKTSTVSFIIQDFIQKGNIVFKYNSLINQALKVFRSIEPDRKILVIMEDIDSLTRDAGYEQSILQFLDGNIQYSNIIVIATTNYPEHLPDRIINRPSRFDRVSYIGTPSLNDRILYLTKKSKTLDKNTITKWANETKGWTLAHIKELILAVEVFDLKYEETLKRINKMREKNERSENYEKEIRGKQQSTGFVFEP